MADTDNLDDGLRGSKGVLVSVVRRSNGQIRLLVDRVRRGDDGRWSAWSMLTFKDFDEEQLAADDPDEQDMTNLGDIILAEIVANHLSKLEKE